MVTLEQVKLLETKVVKVINNIDRVTEENTFLKGKLETYQKRIEELEVLIQRFKDDQGRIEKGILSALDRLNQAEAAIDHNITPPETELDETALDTEAFDTEADTEDEAVLYAEDGIDTAAVSELEAIPGSEAIPGVEATSEVARLEESLVVPETETVDEAAPAPEETGYAPTDSGSPPADDVLIVESDTGDAAGFTGEAGDSDSEETLDPAELDIF
jgi:chromosome segregation ATPase